MGLISFVSLVSLLLFSRTWLHVIIKRPREEMVEDGQMAQKKKATGICLDTIATMKKYFHAHCAINRTLMPT